MVNDKHTTKYHLFTTALEEDSAYIGTYDTPQAAYDAILLPNEVNARLFVTKDDGTLAKVATLMLTQEDVPHRGRITIYFWQFDDESIEVDRKYHKWSALPRKRYDNPGFNHLATGRAEFGRWVESEPF